MKRHAVDPTMSPLRRTNLVLVGLLLVVNWCTCTFAGETGFAAGEWPFIPLAAPPIPEVKNEPWAINEIDRFVLVELEKRGLTPNEAADKAALLRRATLDMTGLPPSVDELEAFLLDDSPLAYERAIDRLLGSPRFGERWGRHWLDVVRFADTSGFKTDYLRPEAFRYRDYVIRSFNDDLPFNRFVQQQLAGDEIEPHNPDAIIATGMLRLYAEESTASDFLKQRQDVLDDVTEVTSLTFMGLTVGCAKCHDHKFDPIEQTDFFRLEACFANMVPHDDIPAVAETELEAYEKRLEIWENTTAEIRKQIEDMTRPIEDAVIQEITLAYDTETRQAWLTPEEQRSTKQQTLVAYSTRYIENVVNRRVRRFEGEIKTKYDALQKRLVAHEALKPQPLPASMSVANGPSATPTHVLTAGDYHKPEEEVQPGFPKFLGPEEPSPNSHSAPVGRRASLAQWLTMPDHPLTARVIVNRLWQHHFGQGIVPTTNDFGAMGQAASNPQLLDWLAAKLVSDDWSLKSIHRLMLTSATYRQSSHVDEENAEDAKAMEVDPDNRYLWHAHRSRLEGESFRDSLLMLSGQLNESAHGPSSYPKLPQTVIDNASTVWMPDAIVANQFRRSIFNLQKRNFRLPLLAALDQPDMYSSCGVRGTTLTATQSLALLNGEETTEAARNWSGKLLASTGNEDQFIRQAWLEIYSRPPEVEEVKTSKQFMNTHSQRIYEHDAKVSDANLPLPNPNCLEPHQAAAYVDFCHALLNSSEFLWVD